MKIKYCYLRPTQQPQSPPHVTGLGLVKNKLNL